MYLSENSMWGLLGEGGSGSAYGSGSGDINSTGLNNSLTLSCAARSIQGEVLLPYSPILSNSVRIVQTIILLFIFFFGVSLGLLVILLIARFKKLQTPDFVIAAQVMVANVILSVIYCLAMVNSIANRWLYGEHMCALLGTVLTALHIVRVAFMFTLVTDRFLVVYFPFLYPKHRIKIVLLLSVASWLVGVLIATPGFALDCYAFAPSANLCVFSSSCSKQCVIYLSSGHIIFTAPGTITPIILFAVLYVKAKKIRKALSADKSAGAQQPDDWKATITFFLMFITVFVFTLPNLVLLLIVRVLYEEHEMPFVVFLLSAIARRLVSLVTVTDPVFILRNANVREVIKEKIVNKNNKIYPVG